MIENKNREVAGLQMTIIIEETGAKLAPGFNRHTLLVTYPVHTPSNSFTVF